jgi:hypothetical protein
MVRTGTSHLAALVICTLEIVSREYRKLGIEIGNTLTFKKSRGIVSEHNGLREVVISWLWADATRFLKESISYASDTEVLLYLACMYGLQEQFDDMMKTIDQAVKINEGIRERFQEPRFLLMLLNASHSERTKIEKLGKKIGLTLPISKDCFCSTLRNIDFIERNAYVTWLALKRNVSKVGTEIFVVEVGSREGKIGIEAYAAVYRPGQRSLSKIAFGDTNNQNTVEELFDKLNPNIYFICLDQEP